MNFYSSSGKFNWLADTGRRFYAVPNKDKTMRPFNLERAKAGDPIQTRDGDACKFIAHVPEALPFNRLVILAPNGVVCARYETGGVAKESPMHQDLFMGPKEVTIYLNVYEIGGDYVLDSYSNQLMAQELAPHNVLHIAAPFTFTV